MPPNSRALPPNSSAPPLIRRTVEPQPVNVHYLSPNALAARRARARIHALATSAPPPPEEAPRVVYTPPPPPVVKTPYEKLQDTLSTYISNLRVPTVKTIKTIFGGEVPSKQMTQFETDIIRFLNALVEGQIAGITIESAIDKIVFNTTTELEKEGLTDEKRQELTELHEKSRIVLELWRKQVIEGHSAKQGGRRKLRKTRRARKTRKTRKNRRS